MHETKWRVYSSKPLNFMEVGFSRNKRYSSDSEPVTRKSKRDKLSTVQEETYKLKMKEMLRRNGSAEARKKSTPEKANNAQSSLSEEIRNLQKQLQDQFAVRNTLESALNHQPLSSDAELNQSIPKPTKELIKEITMLELEIMYLERYLLDLYRRSFDQQTPTYPSQQRGVVEASHSGHFTSPRNSFGESVSEPEKLLDSSIHRSHSSLSQRSASSFRASPGRKFLNKAVDSYYSLPLSMLEQAESTTPSNTSFAEKIGSRCLDQVTETPNSLSEEMIRCISSIYCELSDPPLLANREPSLNGQHCEKRGSIGRKLPFLSPYLDYPFHQLEGSEEAGLVGGSYSGVINIKWICRDAEKLGDIETKLQKFRSLVYRLEDVDPRKLRYEEKLAFWINVHNSLAMHAFLVYGIPQNNLKRVSLVLKAAYNIGGHTISVDTIQNSILGCRLPRPGQWLRLLFSLKTKFKIGDARRAFSIQRIEPLLHFSLSLGSKSDPRVRVFTPKRVFEELEKAKDEFIQSSLVAQKEQKIFLPKIVESFVKDSGLTTANLANMVDYLMLDSHSILVHKKVSKGIEWIPHNFTFHYSISKEIVSRDLTIHEDSLSRKVS